MSKNQPPQFLFVTQFLFHELANNEQDARRFNSINPYLPGVGKGFVAGFINPCLSRIDGKAVLGVFEGKVFYDKYRKMPIAPGTEYHRPSYRKGDRIELLEPPSCHSTSIGIELLDPPFRNSTSIEVWSWEYLTASLYMAFNSTLRDGQTLEKPLIALHEKMLELVPAYARYLQNK